MSFALNVYFQFSSAWSFLRVFFFNVLFRLSHVISSNQLSVVFRVRHWCRILPIRGQLFILDVAFTVTLTVHSFSYSYLSHLWHVHSLTNSQFSPSWLFPYFFFSSFYRSFPLSPNFRTDSHHSAFFSKSVLQFQSSSRSNCHLDYFGILLMTVPLLSI